MLGWIAEQVLFGIWQNYCGDQSVFLVTVYCLGFSYFSLTSVALWKKTKQKNPPNRRKTCSANLPNVVLFIWKFFAEIQNVYLYFFNNIFILIFHCQSKFSRNRLRLLNTYFLVNTFIFMYFPPFPIDIKFFW